ncbi:MAG: sensor histidine kinase KdpD [Acidimicrobiales bacterium]|nr:sensor histidine kinase KdpD [Acidimicrobiales bacterium]
MADGARGRLRIYLGAAPGVGKTYAMLGEGHRRAERGTDVVVAYVEHHARPNTLAMVTGLEVVPRKVMVHRDHPFEEMDLDAVLARRPAVALVDELAHTNVPGSRNDKRWQDVQELLDAGIDVISTVNVQHLESLNDVVERITGVVQRETVPDHVVRAADQVELVDMTPEALRRRMAHGNVYGPEKVDDALGSYFRIGNLTALRELALLWLADQVDESLTDYLDAHGIDAAWEARERVVVALTGAANGEALIRRAARVAGRARGELLGVHVRAGDGLAGQAPTGLERQRDVLTDLGGEYHEVVGDDVADALVRFARAQHATQIVLGATQRSRSTELLRGSVVNRVVRASGDMDVHVISTGADGGATGRRSWRPPLLRSPLTRRRRAAGFVLAVLGLVALTEVLVGVRADFGLPGALMAYVLLVVAVALVGGTGVGLTTAVAAGLTVNWFLTEPYHTLTIADAENSAALVAFVVVGMVVSLLVSRSERRAADATRARREAEALARASAGLALEADPLPSVLDRVRSTFQLEGAALFLREGDGWRLDRAVGAGIPTDPDDATVAIPAGETAVLVLAGATPSADDELVLRAFAAQLATALEQRHLRAEAARAQVVAEGDALRTALLRAVSHDLRTPLASIKASVSSLLQDDIEWSSDDEREFHLTIDEESDRLDRLVGNLLDMSRLQTGVLQMATRSVGWEEVVAAASASLPRGSGDRLDLAVPETLPPILADPALLERAVANVVANALVHGGDGRIAVEAEATVDGRVELRIVDHGPGVDRAHRERLFEPFQRLGDAGTGVGLGLAVAHGFVRAMGGTIVAVDTPGGGLTVVLSLPVDHRATVEP